MDTRVASTLRQMFPASGSLTSGGGLVIAGGVRGSEDTHDAFFDVLPRPDGDLAFLVVDKIAGYVHASLHMAAVRAVLQVLLRRGERADSALLEANAFLRRSGLAETVMLQVFLGLVSPADRTLTYAGAGTDPAYLRRADGDIEQHHATGPILGVLDTAAFEVSSPIQLDEGDVLLSCSHGVFEAWGRDGDAPRHIRSSLNRRAVSERDAKAILDGVFADLDAHVEDDYRHEIAALVLGARSA